MKSPMKYTKYLYCILFILGTNSSFAYAAGKTQPATTIEEFSDKFYQARKQYYPTNDQLYKNDSAFFNYAKKENIVKAKNYYKNTLAELRKYNYLNLNNNDKITYKVIETIIRNNTALLDDDISFYLPINQFISPQLNMLTIGSGNREHTFQTAGDYYNWAEKMEQLSEFMYDSIKVMKDGIKHKITLQKSLVQKTVTQLNNILSIPEDSSPLYSSLKLLDSNNNISFNFGGDK